MRNVRQGVVAFSQFLKMVRGKLEVSEKRVPDDFLRSVWKALDYDDTGYVNSAKWARRVENASLWGGKARLLAALRNPQ